MLLATYRGGGCNSLSYFKSPMSKPPPCASHTVLNDTKKRKQYMTQVFNGSWLLNAAKIQTIKISVILSLSPLECVDVRIAG